MAKRFFASEIWEEDWFIEMPNEYKHFWFYMLAKCDHAGIFRVNLTSFRGLLGVNLTSTVALELINNGKQRLREIKRDVWLIEDFFVYQYGPKFNPKNRVHKSVAEIYEKHGISLNSIRGINLENLTSIRPQVDPNDGVKDKDKDNEEVETRDRIGVKGEGKGWRQMPGEDDLGLELPEIKSGAVLQLLVFSGNKTATMQHVESLWAIFKAQHFTGGKFYNTENDVYSHFINWSKSQKINGTHSSNNSGQKLGTSAARVETAKKW